MKGLQAATTNQKEKMKRVLLILTAAILALVSCEQVEPIQSSKNSIVVDPSEAHFTMDGGEVVLNLTLKSEHKEWSLSGDTEWCVPARKSGKTSTSLKVNVSLNTGAPRTASLQFKSPEAETFVVTVTQEGVSQQEMPSGMEHGINYNDDGSVTFVFYDKDKNGKSHDYAYLIGEFNEWKTSSKYAMNRDEASGCWWYTLTGMAPKKEYMFQYYLGYFADEAGRAYADPYSEVVYETYDRYISSSTYPGLKEYPSATKGAVSSFQIVQDEYPWEVKDYQIKDGNDLVIYELLFRDFSATGDINGALEKMDYLQNLGVTAIELMPIQEFSGSDSWGYNPIAYFALEKSYGTRQMYKKFIDECHKRDIAVIVDVVYNHVHEDHPMAGLFFDWKNYAPLSSNPWFNVSAPHPFSVFYDWNHENKMTRDYIKKSLKYLIEEYKVDGFRFDLTKGFTNKSSNESSASNYDQSRVDILKDYGSYIKSVDPNAVVILEHFADSENYELGKAGLKVWRNMNYEGRNAVLGGAGNFGGFMTESSIAFGTYVGFIESHDEERVCYGAVQGDVSSVTWGVVGSFTSWGTSPDVAMTKDGPFYVAKNVSITTSDQFKIRGNGTWDDRYNYGSSYDGEKVTIGQAFGLTLGAGSKNMAVPSAGTYDIYFSVGTSQVWVMNAGQRPQEPAADDSDPLTVVMRRAGASAAIMLTVPGPKMIWQFGELGYDVSIEEGGRTGRKPLRWEYYDVPARKALYDSYASVLRFRKEYPRFFDMDAKFEWNPSATVKTNKGTVDGKTFYVVANFGKSSTSHTLPSGTWNDYINGGTVSGTISLGQGEFRLLLK